MDVPQGPFQAMDPTEGFEDALERTKDFLFRPFNLTIWISIGLMVLFEGCGSGGGGGGNLRLPNFGSEGGGSGLKGLEASGAAAGLDGPIMIGIVLGAVILTLAMTVVFSYLGARGTMMFCRAIATGDVSLADNWRMTEKPSMSLFKFNLIVMGSMVGAGLLVSGIMFAVTGGFQRFEGPALAVAALMGLLAIPIFVLYQCMASLLRNFVAPLMWKFDIECVPAWELFHAAVKDNLGPVFVFLLIRFGLSIAIGVATMIVGFITCCIGFLPVISQTLTAPLHVFERSYSFKVLESAGPDFAMLEALKPKAFGEPPVAPGPMPTPESFDEDLGDDSDTPEH